MKKILPKIAAACLAATLLAGCTDVLDIRPVGEVLKADALRTEQDLVNLVNSMYTVVASDNFYGGRVQVINELMGDLLSREGIGGDENEFYSRNTIALNGQLGSFYKEPYIAVYRANTTLENLAVAATEATRNNLEGQAKLVRAVCHFELVRLFAQPYGFTADNTHPGIPLRVSTDPTAGVRASVKEVYDQVVKDLQDAERLLPEQNGLYPTKWAAKGLLARVHFQMNDFAKAYDYASQVIASNKFVFETDYAKRFSAAGSTEGVFVLISERNTGIGPRFGPLRGFKSDLAIPYLKISPAFYDANVRNNPNDVRRTALFESQKHAPVIGLKKYDAIRFDAPIVHLTELLLTRAEAAAELNQNLPVAVQDLNRILNRAYGGTRSLLANADANTIKATARTERMIELAGEGDRLQQLKRMGAKGETVLVRGLAWNCPGLVLQFPAAEATNSNGFLQNPTGGCQ